MSIRTSDYLEAIDHLPAGATLVFQQFSWADYERLLVELRDRPHLRVSYDQGEVAIMSPSTEHEEYARFIDRLVSAIAEQYQTNLQNYGSATWKSQRLGRGVEPDSCYYVANAVRIIGKRSFDLEMDPPPDIAVEIDLTNKSTLKLSVYAALSVPEIWRYDGQSMHFYQLSAGQYREISTSLSFPKLTPEMLAAALERSRTAGQSAALAEFRRRL